MTTCETASTTTTDRPALPPADLLTPTQCIAEMWRIANNDDCDGVCFDGSSDQWWLVSATCKHGTYSGVSHGPVDVHRAFLAVLEAFRSAHPSTTTKE